MDRDSAQTPIAGADDDQTVAPPVRDSRGSGPKYLNRLVYCAKIIALWSRCRLKEPAA
jgi:hypothetical protein